MYKKQYAQYDWLKFSLVSLACSSFGQFMMGDLASRHGPFGMIPLCFGQILMFIIYHTVL